MLSHWFYVLLFTRCEEKRFCVVKLISKLKKVSSMLIVYVKLLLLLSLCTESDYISTVDNVLPPKSSLKSKHSFEWKHISNFLNVNNRELIEF